MPTSSSSRFGAFIFFALLILAWTAPYAVVGHTYPVPTFYAEYVAYVLYALVAVAIGVQMVAASRAGGAFAAPGTEAGAFTAVPPRSPRVAIVPLAFAALLLLQTIVLPTQQPSMNVLGACSLLMAAMTVHAGYWTSRLRMGETALHWIAWGLIAGGLFSVFCQVVQLMHAEAHFSPFVVVYNVLVERRPFGNMAQANHLATYICFAFAASVFLAQSRRLPFLLWVVLACVFSTGLALTVSRTPWLQVGVLFVISLSMACTQRRQQTNEPATGLWARYRGWTIAVLTLLIFIVVNIIVRDVNVAWGLHLDVSAAARFKDAGQISPRLSLWRYGWTMFKTHPLLGVGWGEFPRFQYQFVEQLGHVEIANNSHDVLIDILAKTGLAGGAITLLGLGLWAWRTLRVPFTLSRLFAFSMLAILAVHALVEYPQQYLFFLLPAAFLLGTLETSEMKRVPVSATAVGFGAVTIASVVMTYPVLTDYHRAETLYYGDRPEQQYRAAPSTIFGAWGQFGLSTLLSLNESQLQQKLAMHRKAIALLPGEVVVRRYAILLALGGDMDAALDNVKRLKIFAESLNDWPSQLNLLYQACLQNPTGLGVFKAQLVQRYGTLAPGAVPPSDDDDADDADDSDDGGGSASDSGNSIDSGSNAQQSN